MSLSEKIFGSIEPKDEATKSLFAAAKVAPLGPRKAAAAAASTAAAGLSTSASSAAPEADNGGAPEADNGGTFVDPAKLFAVAPPVQRETRRQRQQRELEARMQAAKKGGGVTVKEAGKKRHLSHAKDDHSEEDRRTVFVGNLPNDVDRRQVEKFFKKCGDIESVRIRCQVLADPRDSSNSNGDGEGSTNKKRGRAVRILRKEIKKASYVSAAAYVLFKSRDAVAAAVALSGSVLAGRHISVTTEDAEGKAFMPRDSLFLGNLAHEVGDEDVWKFFIDNGCEPTHVRVIRDRETGLAKGFGYVSFATPDVVEAALRLREGGQICGRDVRICHVQKSKSMAVVPSRREKRKEAGSALPAVGPQQRGGKPNKKEKGRLHAERKGAVDGGKGKREADERPAWMGVTTNPRKKLARDLRPLVEPPKLKEKRAKKSHAPPAKKKPTGPAK